MLDWIARCTFAEASWFCIVAYILHYAEEGPRLVRWFNEHHPMPGLQYTQKKLNVENALLFMLTCGMVFLLNLHPNDWLLRSLVLGIAFGYLINFLFHAVPTLKTGIYSPGVVTASLLFPATAFLLFWKADQAEILGLKTIGMAFISGNVGLPLVIIFTHCILLRDRKDRSCSP